MREQSEIESIEEAEALGPYGDVALGVECAWPETIAALAAVESDS